MTNGSDSSPLSPPRHHSVVTTLPAHWWHTWQMANATVTLLWHTSFMGGALGCSTHTVAHFRSVWRACSVTNASKMSIANVFFHPADTSLQNVADGLCCFDSIDCIYLSICIFFDKHFDVQHCPRVIPIQVFQIRRHLLGFALPTIHWWQTLTIQHSLEVW